MTRTPRIVAQKWLYRSYKCQAIPHKPTPMKYKTTAFVRKNQNFQRENCIVFGVHLTNSFLLLLNLTFSCKSIVLNESFQFIFYFDKWSYKYIRDAIKFFLLVT